MNITIVLGTARKERKSERVYIALQQIFADIDKVSVTAVDVRDYVTLPETVPNWGVGGSNEVPTKWKEVVEKTDAFLFILPEYNHSFPGEWKILVDSLSSEYAGKAAYVVGVSAGAFAGARVSDHVKTVLIELNFTVSKMGLLIGSVGDALSQEGVIQDQALAERIEKFAQKVVE
jgi:NAD(P)H-dependent FMN reductase